MILIYILFALPAGSWHGSHEVLRTTEHGRCEAIQQQIQPLNSDVVYRCETLVARVP
ncbi:MAG: hypothetical protein V4757_07405 [Pseudomonadota bacterium]